jgi:hypothetical protein
VVGAAAAAAVVAADVASATKIRISSEARARPGPLCFRAG